MLLNSIKHIKFRFLPVPKWRLNEYFRVKLSQRCLYLKLVCQFIDILNRHLDGDEYLRNLCIRVRVHFIHPKVSILLQVELLKLGQNKPLLTLIQRRCVGDNHVI